MDFPPPAQWAPGTMTMLILILLSGFFSASETALFYLTHEELRTFRAGNSKQRTVALLLSNPDRLLTAVLFWNLLINLSYFAISIVVAQRLVLYEFPKAAAFFGVFSLAGMILFGEVLPKSFAVVFKQHLSEIVSWPMAFAVRVLDPIIPALGKTTRILRRTFWPQIKHEPYLDADDLDKAVEASESSQNIIQQERQILHNILDLSEIKIEEIMRPRGTYSLIPSTDSWEKYSEINPSCGYLIFQNKETEQIESAVSLTALATHPPGQLASIREKVLYVPWCSTIAETLELLKSRFYSLAVVINEYSETIGIATQNDILDSILSPESSRAKRLLQRDPIIKIAPNRFHVEGLTTLRYLSKFFKLGYEPGADSLVTVAGMFHEELERIPEVGDECYWNDFRIRVINVTKKGQIRTMFHREE
jgi:CBS domain containing-hemolysin-like protein